MIGGVVLILWVCLCLREVIQYSFWINRVSLNLWVKGFLKYSLICYRLDKYIWDFSNFLHPMDQSSTIYSNLNLL